MAKKRIQNLLKHVVCILLCLCVVLPFYMVLIKSFKTKPDPGIPEQFCICADRYNTWRCTLLHGCICYVP